MVFCDLQYASRGRESLFYDLSYGVLNFSDGIYEGMLLPYFSHSPKRTLQYPEILNFAYSWQDKKKIANFHNTALRKSKWAASEKAG